MPRMIFAIRSRSGLGLIETVLAIAILAMVGLSVSEIMRRNFTNAMLNTQNKRANNLCEMIFEKYEYLASVNFSNLQQYNQTNTTASAFFATGTDNMGYEGLTISTVVDASTATADGSRQLVVTIGWGANGKSIRQTKYLTSSAGQMGGAPVHVWVYDASGNGMSGFEVRAARHYNSTYRNSLGTNEVIGITDSTGFVTLNNVSVDPAYQPMSIYARKPGSAQSVRRSSNGFIQGYYARPSTMWNTKTMTVSQTAANILKYDVRNNDFFPLGSLSGLISNSGMGPVNLQVTLSAVASDGSNLYSASNWTQTADNSGYYEFNNVAPGTLNLSVLGRAGSVPQIPPTDSRFQQGYVGVGGNGGKPWIYRTVMADPAGAISDYNVQLRALGSLNLTTKNFAGTSLLPGTTITFTPPDIGYPSRSVQIAAPSDGAGRILLYNLFAGDNEAVLFDAAVLRSAGCPDPGHYLYRFSRDCSANTENTSDVNLKDGVIIYGRIRDSGSTPLNNLAVSAPGLASGVSAAAITDAAGRFSLCGVSAEVSSQNPAWPLVTFALSDNNRRVAATFSGVVSDAISSSLPIANARIAVASNLVSGSYIHNIQCVSDANPMNSVSDTVRTDGSGNYGPICAYFPYQSSQNWTVFADAGIGGYNIGDVSVSTNVMQGGLQVQSDGYYYHPGNYLSVTSQGAYALSMSATLQRQSITGTVLDQLTGLPLQNVTVDYPCNCSGASCNSSLSCSAATNASGQFGPVAANIVGRTSSNPGTVTIQTRDGAIASNTGLSYQGVSRVNTMLSPATPATPIIQDFSLLKKGTGL